MAFAPENKKVFTLHNQGAYIVVDNLIQANDLKRQYGHWLKDKDQSYFESTNIIHWQGWINRLWCDYAIKNNDNRIVLSAYQRKLLFKKIITEDAHQHNQTLLWNQHLSTKKALDALDSIHLNQLNPNDWVKVSEDVRVFKRWHANYLEILTKHNWLDAQMLIGELIKQDYFGQQRKIVLWDFFEFNALQSRWLDYLRTKIIDIQIINPKRPSQQPQSCYKFASVEDELFACANWARQEHEKQPEKTIAIVVGELKSRVKQVDYIFAITFNPLINLKAEQSQHYVVNNAKNVLDLPIVFSAINCLKLIRTTIEYDWFSLYLRDPICHPNELSSHQYALLDASIREYVRPKENLYNLRFLVKNQRTNNENLSSLVQVLENVIEYRKTRPRLLSASAWIEQFSNILQLLNWRGHDELTSNQVNQLTMWEETLSQFSTATLIEENLTYDQALNYLEQLCLTTPQKSPSNVKVKIINLQQAAYEYYQASWVCGLHDHVLPEASELNPLIPYSIQQQNQLPYSSSSDCIKRAEDLFNRILANSKQCLLSYHDYDNDKSLRPMKALADVKMISPNLSMINPFERDESIILETYEDNIGIKFTQRKAPGGTYLLKTQAQCPFQAYATYRLNASPLVHPEQGIDARVQGKLVHQILNLIWLKLLNQENLNALCDDLILQLVSTTVDAIVNKAGDIDKRFVEIEKQRLIKLIFDWLKFEQTRPEFSVKLQEQLTQVDVNNLRFDIKPDRIDLLSDGSLLLIDYKTGHAEVSEWLSSKVKDPQMLVYAIAFINNLSSLAYGKLNLSKFAGISNTENKIEGINQVGKYKRGLIGQYPNWQSILDHWTQSLNELVEMFISGDARVQPEDRNRTCNYCARQSLCRVYQHTSANSNDD